MVAQSYPKGSDEFNTVFDTCRKNVSEISLANLNAAYAAIERGGQGQRREISQEGWQRC